MGATVTKLGKTLEEAFELVKEQVGAGYPLSPDSDMIVFNPSTNETHRYRLGSRGTGDYDDWGWIEVTGETRSNSALDCAITAASIYGPKPTKDTPWIGFVHLH